MTTTTEIPVETKPIIALETNIFDFDMIATLADDYSEQMGLEGYASADLKENNLILQVSDRSETVTYMVELIPDRLAEMEAKYEEFSEETPQDDYDNMWRALIFVISPYCLIRTDVYW